MTKNVGRTDQIIRLVLGAVLILFAIWSGNILGYIGIILVVTALIGYCPLYSLIGKNSCGSDECTK
ncbi:conserved exported hypothetical protein [Sulfurovum sp. enrichment culture clone C5]|uniref:Inner membrane protein YgaP-like transmembrane domain-containing protein n=1 Tax=Sulfurovum sp. enrichment culture clone C5 TaxID=497650 RepID=A0A0S4XMP8_9BACT|nr:conserved exported hypothetical protein [Sulfurovum sp. enrichment culture clone C5]